MRVATDHLNEAVVTSIQRLIVNAVGVHFSKAEFASLGNKTAAVVSVAIVIFFFVFVSHGSAIDHYFGALEGLLRFIAGLHGQLLEAMPVHCIHAKFHAAPSQCRHFGPVGKQRRAFVKGDLVDAELLLKVGHQTDERLANGPGSDYMNDIFVHPSSNGQSIEIESVTSVLESKSLESYRRRPESRSLRNSWIPRRPGLE